MTQSKRPPQFALSRREMEAPAPPRSLVEKPMTIGRLAKATGTQVETIRFYEREGLMSEGARTDANYRLYVDAHVNRLAFIRQCRLLDMPLDEIRTLLRFRDKPRKSADATELLTTRIAEVAQRIRDLKRLQAELKDLHVESAGTSSALPTRRNR